MVSGDVSHHVEATDITMIANIVKIGTTLCLQALDRQ